jgi:hypothetical protein
MKFLHGFLFCAIFAFLNPHNPVESGFAFLSACLPLCLPAFLCVCLPAFVSACFILSEHLCLNAVPYAACLYHFVGSSPFCRIRISAHQGHGSMTGLYLLYYFSIFFGKILSRKMCFLIKRGFNFVTWKGTIRIRIRIHQCRQDPDMRKK